MQNTTISAYLRILHKRNEAEMEKVRKIQDSMPESQRLAIFGEPLAPEEVIRRLKALPLPDDLKALIAQDWPRNYCDVLPLGISDIETMMSERAEEIERLTGSGYLRIGKGPGGDPVVLNFNQGPAYPVGFLRHDELHASHSGEVSSAYRPIESSLERFLFRCVNELDLPGDSYDEWSADELNRPLAKKPWWKFWK